MVVRFAMDELPNYTALPTPDTVAGGTHHDALQFLCPDMDYLDAAYADFRDGRPSRDPALLAMTFSRADPTLAPPGKHTLFLWGQYYPYELASGESWDEIGDREADRMLDTYAQYAPNVPGAVIDKCHRGGVKVMSMCGKVQHAIRAEEAGCDVVVAQGTEAGGHTGQVAGMALIPQTVDAVKIPVLAAGSIVDGRGLAAWSADPTRACGGSGRGGRERRRSAPARGRGQ